MERFYLSNLLALAAGSILLAGCASNQLNYNTVDIASKSNDVLTQQVVYNLVNYVKDPLSVPAQITIDSGTTGTSYSVTPTLSLPLSAMSQYAATATTAMGGSISGAATGTRTAASAGLSGNDTWQQNYIFTPVTDNERFLRLDALYRFAVSGDVSDLSSFPPIHKTINKSRPECLKKLSISKSDLGNLTPVHPQPTELCATSFSLGKNPEAMKGGDTKSASLTGTTTSEALQTTDEYFERGPGCILCKLKSREYLNWLHWEGIDGSIIAPPQSQRRPSDMKLATRDGVVLYVAAGKQRAYIQFLSATLAALNASTSSNAGSAGGSSGAGASNSGNNTGSSPPKAQFFQELL